MMRRLSIRRDIQAAGRFVLVAAVAGAVTVSGCGATTSATGHATATHTSQVVATSSSPSGSSTTSSSDDETAASCPRSRLARPAPLIRRPANLSPGERPPLVIDLGIALPATAEARWPLDRVADRNHFVVAYLASPCPAWKDPIANLSYISSMIDRLKATEHIDPRRVYVTGFSKSGYMAYYVGCDLSTKVAAVAIISSAMVGQRCVTASPVSELTIIGTNDLIPFNGNGHLWSVPQTAAHWRALNRCPGQSPSVVRVGPVVERTWSGCREGSAVAYYAIVGGTHQIPGATGIAPSSPDSQFNAAGAIWAFFAHHRKGG